MKSTKNLRSAFKIEYNHFIRHNNVQFPINSYVMMMKSKKYEEMTRNDVFQILDVNSEFENDDFKAFLDVLHKNEREIELDEIENVMELSMFWDCELNYCPNEDEVLYFDIIKLKRGQGVDLLNEENRVSENLDKAMKNPGFFGLPIPCLLRILQKNSAKITPDAIGMFIQSTETNKIMMFSLLNLLDFSRFSKDELNFVIQKIANEFPNTLTYLLLNEKTANENSFLKDINEKQAEIGILKQRIDSQEMIIKETSEFFKIIGFTGEKLEGIFYELRKNNLLTRDTLTIKTSSNHNSNDIYCVVGLVDNVPYWHSNDIENSNIEFIFQNVMISIDSYSFKSTHGPKSWKIEGKDGNNIELIDQKERPEDFREYGVTHHYKAEESKKYFKHIVITQTEPGGFNYRDRNSNFFILSRVEFFGKLIHLLK